MGPSRFTSHPREEGVLRICIAHENPSLSARFEPANLGFRGKNYNRYITEDNEMSFNGISDLFYFNVKKISNRHAS
jgi:hypothetical protein